MPCPLGYDKPRHAKRGVFIVFGVCRISLASSGDVMITKLFELGGVLLLRLGSYAGGGGKTDSKDATEVLRECAEAA
jgi:hypothetical protein